MTIAETPKIDFVSPLPPVRSGIADYSADLLPHLEPLCGLRVIRLPGQPVAEEFDKRWHPHSAARLGEESRVPLYQMGNNEHHEGVQELALRTPGVLTLHDLVLHHLLLEQTLVKGDFDEYQRRLTDDHGWVGVAAAGPRRWRGYGNAAHFFLTAHRRLLRRQRGVLVHSRWAETQIRLEEPEVRVRRISMGIPLPPLPSHEQAQAFRERWDIPLDAPVLGCFGFQTPIKRTEVAVRALASEPMRHAHLLIVGEVTPLMKLDELASQRGVAERVHVTGFIDYADFESAIAAADVCLNLRYPTAGETSASLLRVLAAGRPAMVSAYGQFADLPDEATIKVPLGEREAEAVVAELESLLGAPQRLAVMGRAARDYVRRCHDPRESAAAVAEACRDWADVEPPGDAPLDCPPATTLMRRNPRGRVEISGAEGVWPIGASRRLELTLTNDGDCSWLAARRGAGGVFVKVEWFEAADRAPMRVDWVPLRRDLDPGDRLELSIETRRPLSAQRLVVEPYIEAWAGFYSLGGPVWAKEM